MVRAKTRDDIDEDFPICSDMNKLPDKLRSPTCSLKPSGGLRSIHLYDR